MSEESVPYGVGRTQPSTVVDLLRTWAGDVADALPELAVGELRDINQDGDFLFITGTPFYWSELPTEVHPRQSWALEEYQRFAAMLHVLCREQPKERLAKLEEDGGRVLGFIERQATSSKTPSDALRDAIGAIRRQVELLGSLYSASEGTLLVLDTNALYWNPALEDWRAPWANEPFTIVLTPAVLREIDQHKVDERQPGRRAKAERLERQIGEYRRRGQLLRSVPLVKGISMIMAVALEPRMADSLPWLDPDHADDRLLASVLEVMRRNPKASVTVVTRDLNFQNKLQLARVPFLTPAEFVDAAPAGR